MAKQLTIRGVPDEVARRLTRLSRAKGKSLNAAAVEILTDAVGVEARRRRLDRYATWSPNDLAEFTKALNAQRVIDEALWG
jgi:plasmid stability protein